MKPRHWLGALLLLAAGQLWAEGAPVLFAVSQTGPDVVLIDEPDLKVIALPVDHRPVEPAVGLSVHLQGSAGCDQRRHRGFILA